QDLQAIAREVGATGKIYYQTEALGISHALLFARELFDGKVIVAFVHALLKATFTMDTKRDSVLWAHRVSDPSQFGVVDLDADHAITACVESPSEFVADLAIIGIYFCKDGKRLAEEMQYLIDNNIREKGEFQFTTALENMRKKGAVFVPGEV